MFSCEVIEIDEFVPCKQDKIEKRASDWMSEKYTTRYKIKRNGNEREK